MPRSREIDLGLSVRRLIRVFCFVLYLTQSISVQASHVSYCQNDTVLLSDYRAKNLTSVPADIPLNTTVLVLSQNRLTIIKDYLFRRFRYLQQLFLSNNEINTLETRSFSGLHNLCSLDLSGNPLSVRSFPNTVFSVIPNLKVLCINTTMNKTRQGIYPDEALKYLLNLRRLSLSAVNGLTFGPGVGSMHKLDELQIIGGFTDPLYNNTFTVFSNTSLKRLTIQNCNLQNIETGAFIPLKRLTSLTFDNTRVGLSVAMRSMFGLQHRNMTDIIVRRINSSHTLNGIEDFILDKVKSQYLRTICVSNLDLGDYSITYVERGFFTSFLHPHCVKKLSLRNHRIFSFSGGFYEMLKFTEINYFDAKADCAAGKASAHHRQSKELVHSAKTRDRGKTYITIDLNVPPNLTYIDLSGSISGFNHMYKIKNTKKLLFLDLSFNVLPRCRIPFVDTLSIQVLNISGIDCSSLPVNLFTNFPSLQVLEMNDVNINLGLLNDIHGVLFTNQTQLKTLSLADNGVTSFHNDLFVNLISTTSLNLANNKLKEIPNTVRHLKALRFLDMSYNAITYLSKSDRIWLEKMSKKTNMSVFFEGNPFSCVCSGVEFTRWILETDVDIVAREKLICTVTNGTMVNIMLLKDGLRDFEIGCKSKFWLIFSVTAASLMSIGVAISVVGYRYRYNIKYWILTKCRRPKNYDVLPNCEYDAFVAYNHHDYRWVCHTLREFLENQRGYRLCLHHRDFLAGESIQQNIVDAMNNSRKIILVISLEFLRCGWGEFEIQMAGMRMVQEGRENVVVVILLEDIPVGQMPQSLINMWKNITFLLWSEEPGDEALFWERLDQSLRSDIEIYSERRE